MKKAESLQELAKLIIEYDENYPGEVDASMEVDAATWQEWVSRSREILEATA